MPDRDPRLISRICHMYYQQGMSQIEIGEHLRLSRFQVARILQAALDEGFVTIQILEPEPFHLDLSAHLEATFGLKAALIVDNGDLPQAEVQTRVAYAAGRYLLEILKDEDVLGISLGSTIRELVESLPSRIDANVTVAQLVGGAPDINSCDSLTWNLAQKFGSQPFFLYAPALVDNPNVKSALLADSHIQTTYSQYKALSMAVVGIGALSPEPSSSLISNGVIQSELLDEVIGRGAVGDVLVYLYDADGQIVPSGLESRIIAAPLADYMDVPYRIAVAAGSEKARAILGALRGGFVNVLVTDNLTAEAVLELNDPET